MRLAPPRPIHPFPARMASSIPWSELQSRKVLRVLDPMMGSGTTLSVARALGHHVVGFDVDPLAVLLTEAWCTTPPVRAFRAAARYIARSAATRAPLLRGSRTFPRGADTETCSFVRYWFNLKSRRQLRALADEIEKAPNRRVRRLLWVAFSRLIIAKEAGVSRARDLAHSRPHRVEKPPLHPVALFETEAGKIAAALEMQAHGRKLQSVRIRNSDTRKLPLRAESVDAIITSPPYLNAIDYLRTSKFSLVWMGHQLVELRKIRSESIGSEVSAGVRAGSMSAIAAQMGDIERLPRRNYNLLLRFLSDMCRAISEFGRVLAPGGKLILVVADCAIRGVRISNSAGMEALARQHGFVAQRHTQRTIPANRRYLPPPTSDSADLGGRMRTEVVLRFTKPRASKREPRQCLRSLT